MRTNTIFHSAFDAAAFADRDELRHRPSPCDPQGGAVRLTRRAALSVILLLSLGLWAALWTSVGSLASAAFG
jgi:hypothetical protein